jgi:uncharacterized protein
MTRHRIVVDTNVLISAILFGGKPRKILDLVISGSIECFLSTAILDELKNVLCRPKFGVSADACFHIVEELHGISILVAPSVQIDAISSDPDDNRVLECAIESRADFIISGDPHLLSVGKFKNIIILSPADYLKNFSDDESSL